MYACVILKYKNKYKFLLYSNKNGFTVKKRSKGNKKSTVLRTTQRKKTVTVHISDFNKNNLFVISDRLR